MSGPLDQPRFRKQLQHIAEDTGRPLSELQVQAKSSLREMRSARNRFAVRAFAWLSRFMYRRGYDPDIIFDQTEFETLRKLAEKQSVVYLVTHKTYLDFFVLFDFLYRRGVAPPFIFGGVNVAFAGFGNLARHAGGIFIRRTFRGDSIYKAVLRHYIAFLIERGHSFMWAIEGTRSRTGKLVLPKLGLLKYVVDASEQTDLGSISYIPVSVAYDQIPDVIDMSAQEAGAEKTAESLSWFVKYIRKTAGHFGNIYVRFGDAVALQQTPDAPDLTTTQAAADAHTIEVQKLAFEICYRINEITPITETSLALMSLLCRGRVAIEKIRADVAALQNYIHRRQSSAFFRSPNREVPVQLDKTLGSLVENRIVHLNDTVDGPVYGIEKNRYLVALYYSNMAVHHFVIAAFTEMGLLALSKQAAADAALFESEMLKLRELFKFEFFFARKDRYRQQFVEEFQFLGTSLEEVVEEGSEFAIELLHRQALLVAESVLRPYLEAYRVVAGMLLGESAEPARDPKTFIAACQRRSREMNLTGSDGYPHVAPRALLTNGYEFAKYRGLLLEGREVRAKRQQFADQLDAVSAQLDEIKRMIA